MVKQTEEQASKPALYFRVRMKYLKWYVFLYDEDISIKDDALGPYDSHAAAYAVAESTNCKDMDKSNVPTQSR